MKRREIAFLMALIMLLQIPFTALADSGVLTEEASVEEPAIIQAGEQPEISVEGEPSAEPEISMEGEPSAEPEISVEGEPLAEPGIELDRDKVHLVRWGYDQSSPEELQVSFVGGLEEGEVSWQSSSTVVSVVDGKLYPSGQGKAVVTASCGEYSASCTVYVTYESIENFAFEQAEYIIDVEKIGRAYEVYTTPCSDVMLSSYTEERDFVYSSDDESVAVITAGGAVYAKGLGTTTIHASIMGGLYEASAEVTVMMDANPGPYLFSVASAFNFNGIYLGKYKNGDDVTWDKGKGILGVRMIEKPGNYFSKGIVVEYSEEGILVPCNIVYNSSTKYYSYFYAQSCGTVTLSFSSPDGILYGTLDVEVVEETEPYSIPLTGGNYHSQTGVYTVGHPDNEPEFYYEYGRPGNSYDYYSYDYYSYEQYLDYSDIGWQNGFVKETDSDTCTYTVHAVPNTADAVIEWDISNSDETKPVIEEVESGTDKFGWYYLTVRILDRGEADITAYFPGDQENGSVLHLDTDNDAWFPTTDDDLISSVELNIVKNFKLNEPIFAREDMGSIEVSVDDERMQVTFVNCITEGRFWISGKVPVFRVNLETQDGSFDVQGGVEVTSNLGTVAIESTESNYLALVVSFDKLTGSGMPVPKTGFYENAAGIFYYQNGKKLTSAFLTLGSTTYYFDRSGKMLCNSWLDAEVEGVSRRLYFNSAGAMAKGYSDGDGNLHYRQYQIDGAWYLFDGDGCILKGWLDEEYNPVNNDSHDAYRTAVRYADEETGKLALRCWIRKEIENGEYAWFYMGSGGKFVGWNEPTKVSGKYYIFDEYGRLLTGWLDEEYQSVDNSTGEAYKTGVYYVEPSTDGDPGIGLVSGWRELPLENGQTGQFYFGDWRKATGKSYVGYFNAYGVLQIRSSQVVYFNLNGHGTSVPKQYVPYGGTITEPETPVCEGYVFAGWSQYESGYRLWDFDDSIPASYNYFTLYAQWEPDKEIRGIILEAKEAKEETRICANASLAFEDEWWVTESVMQKFNTAIANAENVYANETNETKLASATKTFRSTVDSFIKGRKKGTTTKTVSLVYAEENISVGVKVKITPILVKLTSDGQTSNEAVTYASSDRTIATVDAKGVVTGVGAGSCVIEAATVLTGLTATCTVEVVQPISAIKLADSKLSLAVDGDEASTLIVITDKTGLARTDYEVSYDEKFVTAYVDGTDPEAVLVVMPGDTAVSSTKVTIKDKVSGKSASVTAAIGLPADLLTTTLKSFNVSLNPGKNTTLNAKAVIDDGTGKASAKEKPISAEVVWESSDESVATVDAKGKVTAAGVGECEVYAYPLTGTSDCEPMAFFITVVPELASFTLTDSAGKAVSSVNVTVNADTVELSPIIRIQWKDGAEYPDFENVSYKSDNEAVASVDEDGVLTGLRAGSAKITVIMESTGKTAVLTANVSEAANVVTTSRKSTKVCLTVGKSTTLNAKAQLKNEDGTIRREKPISEDVVWESDDEDVAIVDAKGKVTSKGIGRCAVTATAKNGSEDCEPLEFDVVVAPELDSFTLIDPATGKKATVIDVIAGEESVDLSEYVSILWKSAGELGGLEEYMYVTYASDKPQIAEVSEDGEVSGVTTGKAKITVTMESTGKTANIMVNVREAANAVTTTLKSTKVYLTKGKFTVLNAKAELVDVNHKTRKEKPISAEVEWESDDTSVATVDQKGKVTAKSTGRCIITASAKNGAEDCEPLEFEVIVAPELNSFTLQDPVTEKAVSEVDMVVGEETVDLSEYVKIRWKTAGEFDDFEALTYTSDKPQIVEVSEDGELQALTTGKAKISVTMESTGRTVTINANASELANVVTTKLKNRTIYLNPGKTTKLSAKAQLRSEDGTIRREKPVSAEVEWESDDENEEIVTVDAKGKVTAVGFGRCFVTAYAKEGSSDCEPLVFEIVVAPELKSFTLKDPDTKKKVPSIRVDKGDDDSVDISSYVSIVWKDGKEHAEYKEVIYSSSNEQVAEVDADGIVTGISTGRAKITVTMVHTGKQATLMVQVVE